MKNALAQKLEAALRHHQAGNINEATRLYHAVLLQDPLQPDALNLLGVIAHQNKAYQEALEYFDRAISIAPNMVAAHFNKGNLCRDIKHPEQATLAYESALKIDPGYGDAILNLGCVLYDEGHMEAALPHFKKLIEIAPQFAKAHYNLAKCFGALNRLEEAHQAIGKALRLQPDDPDTHFVAAGLSAGTKNLEAAVHHIETAIKLRPNWSAAYTNYGNYLAALDRQSQAVNAYDKALSFDPKNVNAKVNRSLALLSLGDFEKGWKDYRLRADSDAPYYRNMDLCIPRWSGENVQGRRVLIWGEQGLGEEILYAGLLAELAKSAENCKLLCSSKLLTLFKRSFSGIENLSIEAGRPDEMSTDTLRQFDFHLSLADLGAIFRPTAASFPHPTPYLVADSDKSQLIRQDLEAKYGKEMQFVGLSWASSNATIGSDKTIPLDQWKNLLTLPDLTFLNAQYGEAANDVHHLPRNLAKFIITLDSIDLDGDLDDTLALLAAVDLVLTCSNTAAHLAGGAGLNTWVVVPAGRARLWYWSAAGERTRWYESVKIYRKPINGLWTSPIRKISRDLSNNQHAKGVSKTLD
ncbi:MAG: tetratricopeptide repeat protein [Rhodospirillaceae bacterium]